MNFILISGTARCNKKNNLVFYSVFIWGGKSDTPLKLVTTLSSNLSGYVELWERAKKICQDYFKEPQFDDGGYTIFHDHITLLPS